MSTRSRLFRDDVLSTGKLSVVILLFMVLCTAVSTSADSVADFYAHRTIHSLVFLSPGGGYDLHNRLIAREIGRFIPGSPNVVPENMVGAGGLVLANYLSNGAPRDGTYIGLMAQAAIGRQAVGAADLHYDVRKLNWLGMVSPPSVMTIIVSKHAGVSSLDDAKKKEVVLGSVGPGTTTTVFPKLLNDVLGTKFKIVEGYAGSAQLDLAIERGEVDGREYTWSGVKVNKPNWLADGDFRLLIYTGEKPADLNGIPSLDSLITSEADRELVKVVVAVLSKLGFPFATTPDVPVERLSALRKAFTAMANDPAFQNDARQAGVELGPVRYDELEKMIDSILSIPPEVQQRAKAYLE